jgi:hypothetical protein
MGKLIKRAIILALAIPLSGCAAEMLQAAQSDCNAFGITPDTQAFAECVQRRYERRQDRMAAAWMPHSNVQGISSTSATGYLKSQYTSGVSRICTYDRMGSPYVMTLGVTDICPISVP